MLRLKQTKVICSGACHLRRSRSIFCYSQVYGRHHRSNPLRLAIIFPFPFPQEIFFFSLEITVDPVLWNKKRLRKAQTAWPPFIIEHLRIPHILACFESKADPHPAIQERDKRKKSITLVHRARSFTRRFLLPSFIPLWPAGRT